MVLEQGYLICVSSTEKEVFTVQNFLIKQYTYKIAIFIKLSITGSLEQKPLPNYGLRRGTYLPSSSKNMHFQFKCT
jgi:hypothetical protein